MNTSLYRRTYKRWLKQYEKQAYKEIHKTFAKWGVNIPFSIMTEANYEALVDVVMTDEPMIMTYEKIYTDIGLVHGKRVGVTINKELKFFKPNDFDALFLRNIRNYLLTTDLELRLFSIESTYADSIKLLLSKRLEEGKTIREASAEVQALVRSNDFYRWQALRIARTESTTVANYAATQANQVTDYVMEKVWISARDGRTRRSPPDKYDHVYLDGKTVEPNDDFITETGQKLAYPGDPKGAAGDIINCRCAVAYRAKRDSEGNLIKK